MNKQAPIAPDTAQSIIMTDSSDCLAAIKKPTCAAVIWQRQLDKGFQDWIDALDPAHLPVARLTLRPCDVATAIIEVCDLHDTPAGFERARLIDDVAALADFFARTTAAPYLDLRLSPVDTNACRRFHIDAVTMRLICTYRGMGTQYGFSANGAEPPRILTVPTGAAMVLRGTKWPERPASGLLHRSPPIEGSGDTRLVLVLDPVFDAEDWA